MKNVFRVEPRAFSARLDPHEEAIYIRIGIA